MSNSWLGVAYCMLNFKIGKTTFNFLGWPIGGNPIKTFFWRAVINRICTR